MNQTETKPYIAWIACEARFYVWPNLNAFLFQLPAGDMTQISDADAMNHWENGTALFGENAQRIVSNFVHNRDVTRGRSYRTTWDKFLNMSERDERRMLKSEGEGD
jgi:hypothetical protein